MTSKIFFITLTLIIYANCAHSDHLFIPKKIVAKNLLIMLHGCKTTAEEFAQGTRMNVLAEERGFVVYYPEQIPAKNTDRCWNWFFPINQAHFLFSEPELIMANARRIKKELQLDQIFVAGMSSGAAMASIIASCNAREISGAALHSGVSYQAALDVDTANKIILNGPIANNQITSLNAYQCSLYPIHHTLPVISIQGEKDLRVHPANQNAIMEHFLWFHDLMDDGFQNLSTKHDPTHIKKTPGMSGQYDYQISDYSPRLRKVEISNLEHAWSGGDKRFPRNDEHGPDASRMIVDFFGL